MTRLLVSVRDAAEAQLSVAAGADVVDVKEPSRGPLGAADWSTIAAVLDTVAGRVPVSAALGELLDWQGEWPTGIAAGLRFAKFGLAGCGAIADWPLRWPAALTAGRPHTAARPQLTSVAVVYADWRAAAAPSPLEVLAWAPRLGCGAILVDTFDKQRGGLLDVWPLDELAGFVRGGRRAGLSVALAGGLTLDSIDQVLPLEPDLIGVRGAACVSGRQSRLDVDRVRQLSLRVRSRGVSAVERASTTAEFAEERSGAISATSAIVRANRGNLRHPGRGA